MLDVHVDLLYDTILEILNDDESAKEACNALIEDLDTQQMTPEVKLYELTAFLFNWLKDCRGTVFVIYSQDGKPAELYGPFGSSELAQQWSVLTRIGKFHVTIAQLPSKIE